MRLLHIQDDGSFSLVEFTGQEIPPYAILSHTWGPDNQEVTYQDMVQGTGQAKLGFDKICACARQTAADGLRYFWVDTCCIDKSSSAELTESINSMFQWYKSAQVCYAFLEDLFPGHAPKDMMQHCRWFSRGWTLQELIAPRIIKFFNKSWDFVGTKTDHARSITRFTNIHEGALLGSRKLSSFCIAQRMAWAAGRQTKRQEDIAYCLLGIFDVNMPLIYGEGGKAFRRLQEEIIKRDNDLTILAWRCLQASHEKLIGCFAPSPENFAGKHTVVPSYGSLTEFSITNKGLSLYTNVTLRYVDIKYTGGSRQTVYWMLLGDDSGYPSAIQGIYLRKLAPRFYCRLAENNIQILTTPSGHETINNVHIAIESRVATSREFKDYRDTTLSVPPSKKFNVVSAWPTAYWDHTDNMFLTTGNLSDIALLLHLGLVVEANYFIIRLLCRRSETRFGIDIGVLHDGGPFHKSGLIYAKKYQESGVPWDVIGHHKADEWPLTNEVTVNTSNGGFRLVFSSNVGYMNSLWGYIRTQRLVVSVTSLEASDG